MKTIAAILLLALTLGAGVAHSQTPQWEYGAGVQYSDFGPVGVTTHGSRQLTAKLGWTGEFSLATENSLETAVHVSDVFKREWRKHWRYKRDLVRRDLGVDVEIGEQSLTTMTVLSGPTWRVLERGQVAFDCRGMVGNVYRGSAGVGFNRVAVKSGCGVRYGDPDIAVRVNTDYLYLSPGVHIPVIGAEAAFGF